MIVMKAKILWFLLITTILLNSNNQSFAAAPTVESGTGNNSIIISNNLTTEINTSIANGMHSIAVGNGAVASGDKTLAIGNQTEADGKYAIAIGNLSNADSQGSLAVGYDAEALAYGSTAIGYEAKASGDQSLAMGFGAEATGNQAIAVGYNASADGYNLALGYSAEATGGQRSVAVGRIAKAYGNGSTAIGNDARAKVTYGTAIGHGAKASAENSVALGTFSQATEAKTVSMGGYHDDELIMRRIVNINAGINNNDAMNVSQIKNITGVDWQFNEQGEITGGGFNINNQSFTTIQSAFDYLSNGWKFEATNDAASSVGNAGASAGSSNIGAGDTLTLNGGKNIEISSDGNDKYTINMKDDIDVNSVSVGGKVNISSSGINMGGADIATGGGNIDMGGGRITNVAGGAIAQGSTDAVNGGQLWDAYQRMDAMGGDIYRRMDDLREDVNIVGAHAAALSGLHPIDYNPYEPTTLSAAVGTYRDEYAVAVGVFHYAKENVMFNLGASLCSDGDLMGRAGVSFTVGKSSDKPKVAGTMNGLRNQVIAMQAKLDELEAEKKKDKELLRRNEEIMEQNAELIRELTKKLEAKR